MTRRYYVYRLIDNRNGDCLFQGKLEVPEQSDSQTMNEGDARSMVADAAIRQMIRSSHRPKSSSIEFCELRGPEDERILADGENFLFDWTRCTADTLELKLGEED